MSEANAELAAPPLIDAKLVAPSVRRDVVDRARLAHILRSGSAARLTVFEAPAGYG